jgi:hypothetical protein
MPYLCEALVLTGLDGERVSFHHLLRPSSRDLRLIISERAEQELRHPPPETSGPHRMADPGFGASGMVKKNVEPTPI